MDFNNFYLWIASCLSGIWNILNEKFISWKRSVCVFMLGFGFCYTPALIMSHYGYDSEVSTCVGYICGVVSTKIYGVLIRFLDKVPEILEKRVTNND